MKKRNIIIAPSILTAPFDKLSKTIKELENANADYLHLDIMDGVFVPPITFGEKIVSDIKKVTKLPLDTHLMIINPENHIENFAKSGSDIISVHIEGNVHVHRLIMKIRSYGIKAGIVLNPHTPVSMIAPIIDDIDHILLMSVDPGYGGQKFIKSVYKKITEARKLIENRNIALSVDGGINFETAKNVINAGADFLVAGSAIIDSENKILTIEKLRNAGSVEEMRYC